MTTQGRNRVRPRIHYFFYRQRMFTRVPAGGPITGGTRVVITGEGIDGAAATYDAINAMLVAENLLGSTIRRWYEIEMQIRRWYEEQRGDPIWQGRPLMTSDDL
jgi:hypothetical protein